MKGPLIINLDQAGTDHVQLAGNKSAFLGEIMRNIPSSDIRIPPGFVVTAHAFTTFLAHNRLQELVSENIKAFDLQKPESIKSCSFRIREGFRHALFPKHLEKEIIGAYHQYARNGTLVAVRSSAAYSNPHHLSFAGMHDNFLDVNSAEKLLSAIRACFASLFSERSLAYACRFNIDLSHINMAVCVQQMVRAHLGSAGVAFSLEMISGFRNIVHVSAVSGLAEALVQGNVNADEFLVFKPTLKQGFASIICKCVGKGNGCAPSHGMQKKSLRKFIADDPLLMNIATAVCRLEEYFSKRLAHDCPVNVEWALDGETHELYIVQVRPIAAHIQKNGSAYNEITIDERKSKPLILATGMNVSEGIVTGIVACASSDVASSTSLPAFTRGKLLVTPNASADWFPWMLQASGMIANTGSKSCHAAILAREIGMPGLFACDNATGILRNEQVITLCAADSELATLYDGHASLQQLTHDIPAREHIRSRLMLNMDDPTRAFHLSMLPHHGVGLVSQELIINKHIGLHPMALIRHKEDGDASLNDFLHARINGFSTGPEFFICTLAMGIAKIAAAFYPEKVVVSFSNMHSGDYRALAGGKYFEQAEPNPSMGWRGAARYYSPMYGEAFDLECKAINKVRTEFGLTNVAVMLPFCRTVDELSFVSCRMRRNGLQRGRNALQVYLMVGLPANIIMADEFAKYVDGFWIDLHDLTQFTLGVDRSSPLVAYLYDEKGEPVRRYIRMLVEHAKKKRIELGVCGHALSDFPEFVEFVLKQQIHQLSVEPAAFLKTLKAIGMIEKTIKPLEFAEQNPAQGNIC